MVTGWQLSALSHWGKKEHTKDRGTPLQEGVQEELVSGTCIHDLVLADITQSSQPLVMVRTSIQRYLEGFAFQFLCVALSSPWQIDKQLHHCRCCTDLSVDLTVHLRSLLTQEQGPVILELLHLRQGLSTWPHTWMC